MNLKNSSITSSAAEQPRSTGTALCSSGSSPQPNSALAKLHRDEVDHRLQQSFTQLSGTSPTFRISGGEIVGMKWTCPSDRLPRALAIVEAAFAPAPEEELAKALYGLRVMTRGRDGEVRSPGAGEVEIAAWVQRLGEYPGDVAISVIQDWPKRSQWWPSWFEVQEALDKAMSQRRVMKHMVLQLLAEGQTRKRIEEQPEPEEHRAKVIEKALSALTGLGPFRTTSRQREIVTGRTDPSEAERRAAEATLEQIQNSPPPRVSLSPLVLQTMGIRPREPLDNASG